MRAKGELRQCKDCERVRELAKFRRKEKWREHRCVKCTNIWRRYGITGKEFYAMMEEQLHSCLICEELITEETANIDHCHDNKNVRALLCRLCNLAIGHLRHDKEIASRAVEYLIKHT